MIKKEHYRNNLPHYQMPGQCYMITWCLYEAIPKHAFKGYKHQLDLLKIKIDSLKKDKSDGLLLKTIEKEYSTTRRKYIKAFDDMLALQDTGIDLSRIELTKVLVDALNFWHTKRLQNFAYCIMPNHVHWVVAMNDVDENGKAVYLQDIMHSVKSYSANAINKLLSRKGVLWHHESFDTTIRNEKHFMNAVNYTINNPVAAGFVNNWKDWLGTKLISSNF